MTAYIFIVEDHPIMRRAMTELLNQTPDLHVCGAAATVQEALDLLPKTNTDLVVIDLSLPGKSGLELVRILQRRQPALPCLMFSSYQEDTYVQEALDAGVHGYLFKDDPRELTLAIRSMLHGQSYLPTPLRKR